MYQCMNYRKVSLLESIGHHAACKYDVLFQENTKESIREWSSLAFLDWRCTLNVPNLRVGASLSETPDLLYFLGEDRSSPSILAGRYQQSEQCSLRSSSTNRGRRVPGLSCRTVRLPPALFETDDPAWSSQLLNSVLLSNSTSDTGTTCPHLS